MEEKQQIEGLTPEEKAENFKYLFRDNKSLNP